MTRDEVKAVYLGKRLRAETTESYYGITDEDMADLAIYDAEVARGLMHTWEYRNRMKALQQTFDAAQKARASG